MKRRSLTKPFADRVRAVVAAIPKGETLSYGQVAAKAGSPGAARAVGSIMKHNRDPHIPCHRVILSNGRAGQYNRGGSPAKQARLRREGVTI